jgi:hypothetical protein
MKAWHGILLGVIIGYIIGFMYPAAGTAVKSKVTSIAA